MVNHPVLRVGVVGYGYWGSKHVRVLESLPDVQVTVIDSSAVRRAEAQMTFRCVEVAEDLDESLDRLDAVVVATPPATHGHVAMRALEGGCHVLVEKPLATSVEVAESLVEAADARDLLLMVGHTFEYNPAVRMLKEIIDSGSLGRILYMDTARLSLGRYQPDINVIWDLAPHDISIVSYLLDELPRSTAAWTQRNVGAHADVAYLRLDFERAGIPAFVHVSWLDPQKVRRVTVVGERKMVVYDDTSNERIRIYDIGVDPAEIDSHGARAHAMPVTYRTGAILSPHVPSTEPLLEQDNHFVSCVRLGLVPDTPGRRGLEIVRVLAATEKALLSGLAAVVDSPRPPEWTDDPRAAVSQL